MTALKIIGVILLIFLLIGLLRVGAIVSFGDEVRVQIRVGAIKLTILPRKKSAKPKGAKKAKKPQKPKDEPEEEAEKKPKKKRKLPKPTFDEILDLVETALSALGRMLRRVCKRLRIDPLELLVVFGGDDPAAVAKTFGYADAAVFAFMPRAEELFYIPNPSIALRMDFQAEKTAVRGTVGLSLRVCDLFAFVFTLVIPLAKWALRFFRAHRGAEASHRGAPPPKAPEETPDEKENETEKLIA